MTKPDILNTLVTLMMTIFVLGDAPFTGAFNTTLSVLSLLCSTVAIVTYFIHRAKYKAYQAKMDALFLKHTQL